MKIYVQNGYNKKVITTPNYTTGVKNFIKSLVITNSNGSEIVELSPITFVSKCGFMNDLQKANMLNEVDEMKMFKTEDILRGIGRKDIAKWIRSVKVDSFTKKLLNA